MKNNLLLSLPLTLLLLSLSLAVYAGIPENYYSSIDGKTGEAIRETLFDRIKGHTSISYGGLEPYYAKTDLDAQDHIMDMYSLCSFDMSDANCSQKNVCDCWNKEHSVPQSWFNEGSPMKSDLFHVIPTDARVNNFRGNMPYGETSSTAYIDNDKKALGHIGSSSFSGYSGKVFEPDDEYKGDFARIYFYMATRYKDKDLSHAPGNIMFAKTGNYSGLTAYSVALLLKWHRQDPVSQKEIDRNNAVYGIQKNRNPFVDYPCLAEYIWGEHKGEKLDLSAIMSSENEKFLDPEYNSGCNCKTDDPTVLYPKQSTTVSVGSASVGEAVSTTVFIQGANLTQSLSLSISGTNAAYFSLKQSSVSASEVLNGYNLTVTYTPTATSTSAHTATLTISSSELKSARTVTLTGVCKAELVYPFAGSECHLHNEGVGTSATAKIPIKGTNLTKSVNVGLISGAPSTFTVSPSSFTAEQMNMGDTITITYTPTAIGEQSTKIYINQSNPSEFDQRFVSIYGNCSFVLGQPTDINHESATLHWVKTEKNSYMVDVFILKQIEDPEVTILNSDKGEGASSKSYTYTDVTGYIRLGSSKNAGSITYTGLDLSKPSTLVITAKAYSGDSDVKCKVTAGGKDTTITLDASDSQYVISLPASSSSATLTLACAEKGKRVLIKNVTITTGGTKEEREHLTGYPRSENYLFHTVSGLLPETEYSYTVTPEGLPESEIATFTTTAPSSLESIANQSSIPNQKILLNGQIYFQHSGHLYNLLGNQVE